MTDDSRITIPHLFSPRSYQRPVMEWMDQGGSRAITVWHRRAGKDLMWVNQTIKRMLLAPFCGTYLHVFPKLTQGRRDLWDAKTSPDSGGRPFRAHFPPALVMESSETEMQITLRPMPHQQAQEIPDGRGGSKKVGSVYQVMGTDAESLDNLRGINAAGVIFSEFADQDPEAWSTILEPVLLENKGWAAFAFTPKGRNHAYQLVQAAQGDPSWFTQILTVRDTLRDGPGEDGLPIITEAQIEELRRRGVAEEIIQQEYYCDFRGFLHGTIYGDLLTRARADGRITRVPYETGLPVGTMWDIGRTDATAIWFFQVKGAEIRFIDYYANIRQGADHYVKVCREKPYLYGAAILPHDARHHAYTAAESPEEFISRTLCRAVRISGKLPVQTGIELVRRMFSRFVFDEVRCGTKPTPEVPSGLDGLENYRRKWDDEKGDFSGEPVHDNSSHPADALRTGAVGWEDGMLAFLDGQMREVTVEHGFDPRRPILGGFR